MSKLKKSVFGAIAVAAAILTATSFSSCSLGHYKIKKLENSPAATATVASNGGFVVEKGDYVYFINGKEDYWAGNKFGDVVKGSLMRIAKADLANGNYAKAQTVVPMLFASENSNSGIFIYGEYVYYATPTTGKDRNGQVKNDMIDFKRAKLDGTDTMKDCFFRSTDNTGEYRFVEKNGEIYCIYAEAIDGVANLKSCKVVEKNGKVAKDCQPVVLSSGATSFYFDKTDANNGTVYYTMSVTDKIDSDEAYPFGYNQLYRVTPDATAVVNAKEASYTASNAAGKDYRTYDYDKEYLEDNYTGFEAKDYSTYPYVNLGELVLDGIGSSQQNCKATIYNTYPGCDKEKVVQDKEGVEEPSGYTYTIKSYQNGGLYFTRAKVQGGAADNKIYYLSDKTVAGEGWTPIEGNKSATAGTPKYFDVVSTNSEVDADGSGLYYYTEAEGKRTHEYFYVKDSGIYKASTTYEGTTRKETEAIKMVTDSTPTLLFAKGDYLYYYGTSSTNLSRVNYTGKDALSYNWKEYIDEEYKTSIITQVSVNTAWYKPEFVGNTLLYCNGRTINELSYNYVYAMDMSGSSTDGNMTAAELNAVVDKYDEFFEYSVDADSTGSVIKSAMTYVFYANSLDGLTDVEDLYSEYQLKEINDFFKDEGNYADLFKDKDAEGKVVDSYARESYFVNQVGATKEEDAEAIKDGLFKQYLQQRPVVEDEEDKGMPTWAIVLICVGAAAIVGAAIAIPCVYVSKKKKKQRLAYEATRVRQRKKIDVTDDKTIDVYATESEETATESAETTAEEPVEVVEEVVDTPVAESEDENKAE